jgi:heme exporter protein D
MLLQIIVVALGVLAAKLIWDIKKILNQELRKKREG